MDETTLDYETAVSETGTRHLLDKAAKPCHQVRNRQTALCSFGVPLDSGVEAVRDCEFCLAELAEIRRRTKREEAEVPAIDETLTDSENDEPFGADAA
jgi:hypothetical protein